MCRYTAVRLGQKARAGADLLARPRGAPPEGIIKGEVADWLRARLAEKPDLTMRALAAELCERGTSMTHDTGWRFVRRQELTLKRLWWRANRTAPRWRASGNAGRFISIDRA